MVVAMDDFEITLRLTTLPGLRAVGVGFQTDQNPSHSFLPGTEEHPGPLTQALFIKDF